MATCTNGVSSRAARRFEVLRRHAGTDRCWGANGSYCIRNKVSGDTLQFSRYAPLVRERGGRVLIECQPDVARLLTTLDAIEQVIPQGDDLPAFSRQVPLMSLAGVFATTPETVPCEMPYLLADRELVQQWSERVAGLVAPEVFRVGLTWAGSAGHPNDAERSIPAGIFDVLSGIQGVAWFNVQKGRTAVPGLPLLPMAEFCKDLADTAAAILNLDLVISVDTSVAHLAGALERPVWTLLPYAADWRWLRNRSDTPWYPTMRLFRQPQRGDWNSVIGEVRQELEKLVGA